MELTPKSRRETFLAAAGGQDVTTPTPVTREEVFLDAIAKGGGGGSSGGGVLVVGVTFNSLTNLYECNKTAGEIWAAYAAGSNVVFSDTEYDEVASLSHAYVDSGTYGFFAAGKDSTSAWMAFTAEASNDYPVQVQGE